VLVTTNIEIKVGDHFYASWGYDQTNVDFYEVVGLTKTGVKLQRCSRRIVVGKGVVAGPNLFGPIFFVKLQTSTWRSDPKPWVSSPTHISGGGFAYFWDGEPKYDTLAMGGAGH
jgi:hypothetical protein